jgi:hypothetical protein
LSALTIQTSVVGAQTPSPETTTTAWSDEISGVRLRIEAPISAQQGDAVRIAIELDTALDRLPAGRRRLDTIANENNAQLELVGADGKPVQIRPYDPNHGMPPVYPKVTDPAHDLGSPKARSFTISFPLARAWDALPAGVYKARLTMTYSSGASDAWTGTLASQQFEIRVATSTPRAQVYLLPKMLRIEQGQVVYHRADAEEVRFSTRNGFFTEATITSSDGSWRLGGVPEPDDANPIDDGYSPNQRPATYTIVVFETADAPQHLMVPAPGSGSYRELWRRTLVPSD